MKWETWVKNSKILETDFGRYLNKGTIRKGATDNEIMGHLHKAKRNLLLSRRILDELQDFYEWSIVAYYYAVYQAALALCAVRGYKTKSHMATICILMKSFYPHHLTKEDVKTVAETVMVKDDIEGFVELKKYREDATYSISIEYEKKLAENLGRKAINFVNKVEKILEVIDYP